MFRWRVRSIWSSGSIGSCSVRCGVDDASRLGVYLQVDPYFFYLGGSYTRFFVDVEGFSLLYEA